MYLPPCSDLIRLASQSTPTSSSSNLLNQPVFEPLNAPSIYPEPAIEPSPTTLSRIQTTVDIRLRSRFLEVSRLSLAERTSYFSPLKSPTQTSITKPIKIIHALSLMLNGSLHKSMYFSTDHEYSELRSVETVEFTSLEEGRLGLLIDKRYDRLICSIFRPRNAKKRLTKSRTYAWWSKTNSKSVRAESRFDTSRNKTQRSITIAGLFENLYIQQLYKNNRTEFTSTIVEICKLIITELGLRYEPHLYEDGSLDLSTPIHRCASLPDHYSNIDELVQKAISHFVPTSPPLPQRIESTETFHELDESYLIFRSRAETSSSSIVFPSSPAAPSIQAPSSSSSSQWMPISAIENSITKPIKLAHALSFIFSDSVNTKILSLENDILQFWISDQDDRLIHQSFSSTGLNDLFSRNTWWDSWSKGQGVINVKTIITPQPGIIRAIRFPSLLKNPNMIRLYKNNPDQFKETLRNSLNWMVQKIETPEVQISEIHDPFNCPKIYLSLDYAGFEAFVQDCINQFVQVSISQLPRTFVYGQPLLGDLSSTLPGSSSRRFIRPSAALQERSFEKDHYFR